MRQHAQNNLAYTIVCQEAEQEHTILNNKFALISYLGHSFHQAYLTESFARIPTLITLLSV